MRIAVNVSPLESGHKVRGAGFYTVRLIDSIKKYHPENEYLLFSNFSELSDSIDIIHYPFFDPFFLTLPRIHRFPFIVTVHDLIPLIFPKYFPAGIKGKIKWEIQKKILKKADAVITDSVSSKEDIKKITGIDENKIYVVYLAAGEEFKKIKNHKKITEIIKKYNLPEKFALYVGDVTWNKNLPNLINAVKKINIPLVLVGKAISEDNNNRNAWNADLMAVRKLMYDDKRFIRLGFMPQDDLTALYQTAVLLVMPSRYEGFGLPILEAMQAGCPVITTKCGSLKEVAGSSAFFVDPEDVSSIADGIYKVFFNEDIQRKLSTKGIEQVEKFSWEKTAKETIEVYEYIVNEFNKKLFP